MDQKKLDRLIKLAKLANHNPNDGEANSAARALSKMLSEENYKWLETAKKNGGTPPKPQSSGSSSVYEKVSTNDIVITISQLHYQGNPTIYQLVNAIRDEINRRPTYQESRYERKRNPFDDSFTGGGWDTGKDWEEYFRQKTRDSAEEYARAREEHERRRKEERRKAKERNATNWSWTGERSGEKGFKKTYEQKCRDCSVCGVTRLTTDTDNPYVCYECKRKR